MRARAHFWTFLLTALLLMANPGRAQKVPRSKDKASAAADKWAESTLKKMTLEEKLGQLVMVFYFGGFTSTDSPAYKELLRLVEEEHIGGLVVRTRGTPLGIERSQVYPTAELANQLQAKAKLPLLVGADFERGTAMRLEEGTPFPHAMAVAATGDPKDAYTMGVITALEARAVGIHWIFAPVADVNNNPANPIINTRSFGEDPARVSEFVEQFVRGVEENGVLSTTKHFPGHGDTSTDSHLDLPTIAADRARLAQVEFPPFRAAIAAGTSTVMTGHLSVPAYEPDPNLPATLSPNLVTDLLRKEMGFDGIVVTDALDMAGVTSRYAPEDVAVRAILAGSDVLLVPPLPEAALKGLKHAVESGRIPMSRIDESVRRVLRAKAQLGLNRNRSVAVDRLNLTFRRPEFVRQALEITGRGVTLLRDEPRLLPLDATRPMRVLLLVAAGDPDPYPGEQLEQEFRWRVTQLQVVRVDTVFSKPQNVKLPPPDSYDLAVAAVFVRVADRKNSIGVPDDQAPLINALLESGKPALVMSFGSPYLIASFPAAKTWLATFSTVDVAQQAAVRALFGQTAIGGILPVSVPGVAKIGDGLQVAANPMALRPAAQLMEARLRPVYELLESAVGSGAFPGGVLAVGHRGELAVHAFGRQTYERAVPAIEAQTMYDTASLSKAVVTATLVSMFLPSGRIQLDFPVARFVPEFAAGPQPEWRAKVTVRHLLTHTSGLPGYRPYFSQAKNRKELLARLYAEPLEAEPGTRFLYSDLGFILLGEMVERLTGKTLDALARERIFDPLQMAHSTYNPPRQTRRDIPPTENDPSFRKRLVQGEVHDENAWVLGGVAGHAGLFSTAPDLAAFSQMLLNGGIYAHRRLMSRTIVEQMTAPQKAGEGQRTLGWDVPTELSSSGKYFSARSFGHLGFTGTSLWIDPDKELFVILLTNRVYPTRDNEKIRDVRPALHDAVVEALGLVPEGAARQ